jgi:hypothetical protein
VPLPESLYTDTSVFALKDESGNVVDCDFRTAAKWWRDKQSIRWLHIDFQTSLAANQEKKFILHNEPASHAVTGSKLSITDLGTKYQVTTGPLRFTVKKQGFNLFDEAWIDESGNQQFDAAHQVITAHTKGFSLLSGTTRYYASNDNSITSSIQRQGPMSAVIKLEGRLKNSSGTSLYYFLCRIYAYNNSKIVKVVFSFENRNNDATTSVNMNGAKEGTQTGALQSAQDAFCLINGIEDYRYGGVLDDSGSTRLNKSVDLGWASLSDGQKGVGASVRWFWQNYPSSIEVNGSGELNVGLFSHRYRGAASVTTYPPRYPTYYRIYAGMSKTHEIRFVFYNDDSNDEVRSQLVGATSRCYAFAPAEWFCRGTRAMGNVLVKNNQSLYTVAQWNQVSTYETSLTNGGMKCVGNTNAMIGGKDAYDYFAWGDNPHQFFGAGNLMWNGNYYDLPHTMWYHFIRSLDYRFLDYAEAHVSHIQDMHTVHFEPADWKDGGNRYCPPTNHIGADSPSPNVQDHTSHHKTQSEWEKYYLTGEDRPLDVAFKGLKRIKRGGTGLSTNVYANGQYWYARRPAHVLFTLTMGYKHTLNSQDLSTILSHYNAIKPQLLTDPEPGTNWLVGLLTEALVDVYEITGDADVVNTLKVTCDKVRNPSANSAFGLAFLARYYNNMTYLNRSYTAMTDIGNGISDYTHHEADYSVSCHSMPRAFYYFALPDSANNRNVNLGIRNEDNLLEARPSFVVQAMPNPFNSNITIRVEFKVQSSKFKVQIFNILGELVKSLPARGSAVAWNGRDQFKRPVSPGIYFVKIITGRKSQVKKVVLK